MQERVILQYKMPDLYFLPLLKHFYHSVILVVTTVYNIYKQYFHLPIALFGKYTTKMGDLVVYHKQNYPIYSMLCLCIQTPILIKNSHCAVIKMS